MKTFISKIFAVICTAFFLFSCGSLDQLGKNNYKITPAPLEVHGGKVKLVIKGKFPPSFMAKDVALTLTPILKYEGGQTKYKEVTYQGEEFPANNPVIPEAGKVVYYTSMVDYVEGMKKSKLIVRVKGQQGATVKDDFKPIELVDGVITTSLLVDNTPKVIVYPHEFERVTKHQQVLYLNFPYNSSFINKKEYVDEDYKQFKAKLKEISKSDNNKVLGIDFVSYASPEGEATLNKDLTDYRNKSSVRAVSKLLKRMKLNTKKFNLSSMGADWEGFYQVLRKSDLEDKAMMRRSLDETPLLETKEKTLRSLKSTYVKLENQVLSQLRRTKVVLNYEVVGKSNEEILEFVKTNPNELNVKELLYAATLVESIQDKVSLYTKGIELYPTEYRFYNNLFALYYNNGNLTEVEKVYNLVVEKGMDKHMLANIFAFKVKTTSLKELDDVLKNFTDVSGLEVNYNKGIVAIKQGKYKLAINQMKGTNDFNLALAKVLNKDYQGAINTLNQGNVNTAKSDYLRAIASIRLGKTQNAKGYIKSSGEKDASFVEKAKNDLEFRDIYAPKIAK